MSWKQRVVAIGAYAVIAGLAVALFSGMVAHRPKADDAACPAHGAAQITSAAQKAQQHMVEARRHVHRALRKARHRAAHTASGRRDVARLERQLARAKARTAAWHGTKVQLDDTALSEFKLGRDVNAGVRTIPFTTSRRVPGPRGLVVGVGPFVRSAGGRELTSDEVHAWATLERDRRHGTISFCVLPSRRLSMDLSGQFTGSLVVEQGRVQRLSVPVSLDLPYPRWHLVVLAGFGTCLLCSFYTFILRRSHLPTSTGGLPNSSSDVEKERSGRVLRWPFSFFKGWAMFYANIAGVVTIAAGLIGATTAFISQYVGSDTWDATVPTWFTFVGAIATAYIAGATTGKIVQNLTGTTT